MSKSLKENYLYNIMYEVLIIMIPLITSPYLSRTFGADQIGIYTYSYTIVSYFVLFARLGIVNHGSREIAKAKNKEGKSAIFFSLFTVQLFITILIIVLYAVYLTSFIVEYRTIAAIQVLYLLSAGVDINWFFFGIEEFKITVNRNIVIKVFNTCMIFIVVKGPEDLVTYVAILAVSNFFGQLAVWTKLKNFVIWKKPDKQQVISHIKPLLILFIPTIAVSLYKMMDKIMIGNICPMAEVAYYEYATMFINLPLGFITSLGTVMMPRIASLVERGDHTKSKQYTSISMVFVMALSIAMAFGLAAIAPTFIPIYLGEEFAPSSKLLTGLAVTVVFLSWANVIRTQFLIPYKRDKEFIISLLCGATVNLAINFALIRIYGAWGAVIGTIVAEFVVCLLQTIFSRKELEIGKYLRDSSGFLVIGATMFIVVKCISYTNIEGMGLVILQIFSGIIIYTVLSALYVFFFLKQFDLSLK